MKLYGITMIVIPLVITAAMVIMAATTIKMNTKQRTNIQMSTAETPLIITLRANIRLRKKNRTRQAPLALTK